MLPESVFFTLLLTSERKKTLMIEFGNNREVVRHQVLYKNIDFLREKAVALHISPLLGPLFINFNDPILF